MHNADVKFVHLDFTVEIHNRFSFKCSIHDVPQELSCEFYFVLYWFYINSTPLEAQIKT